MANEQLNQLLDAALARHDAALAQIGGPAPVHLAEGGMPFSPVLGVKGTAREELDKIKADYDAYNAQVDAYNKQGTDYANSFYTDKGNNVIAQRTYNARAKAYNTPTYYTADDKGNLSAYTPAKPFSNPVFEEIKESPGYFMVRSSSVAAPGAAPVAPTVTPEQMQAKADAAKRDASARQTAVSVAFDPASYGLSMNRLFADGGEVKEPWLPQVSTYSELTAQDMYPGQQGQFDQRDAARHMLAAGTLARKYGPGTAELLGKAHEITTSPLRYIGSKLGISEMPVDYEQDLHNNRVGIELAARSKNQKDLEDLVMQMAEQAKDKQISGKPWTGRPVRGK